MEILMKVKCTSSPSPNTIKIVDHHHQLQQQHNPAKSLQPNGMHHSHGKHNFNIHPNPEAMLPNPCLDYTTNTTMDCCAVAAQKQGAACQVIGSNSTECPPYCEYATCCSGGVVDYACCAGYNSAPLPTAATHANNSLLTESAYFINATPNSETQATYEYQEPEENFVSIEDERIKAFLQKIGEEQKLKEATTKRHEPAVETVQSHQAQQPLHRQQHTEVFEIIELDVARDVEKLQRLRESAEKRVKQKSLNETEKIAPQFFLKSTTKAEQHRQSPNISLVPKTVEDISTNEQRTKQLKSKENIIARIDLLDSDSEVSEYGDENCTAKSLNSQNDTEDDEDTTSSRSLNPLLAAAAVSCELGCDNDEQSSGVTMDYHDIEDKVYVLTSDDENLQFIDEREEGTELRWDDFEDHSNSRERQIFECHICAKTVQSNYNLRRHMMIHTGERPFGCDLCDRRFREISDLKKHRRRHANQADFLCMICRIDPPLESDSTRCGKCDTKNGTLIAAVRPDTVKPPPEFERMFGLASRSSEKRKTLINQVSVSDILVNNDSNKEQPGQSRETSPIPTPPLTSLTPTSNSKFEDNVLGNMALEIDITQSMDTTPPKELNTAAMMRALARKRETFKCPLCKRVFGTRHNLKRHFMIHTGEKPYSCPHCRKPFRELSTLKKHMVTHRRDRWYKCLRCPQKYRDYLDYMEHKKSHKEEGSDFESDTDAADSKVSRRLCRDDALNSHDDEDEDTMEYDGDCLECCECGRSFTDIDQFSEHIKEHEQNRILYECYICQQLFDAQNDLVEHMNDKHQTEA